MILTFSRGWSWAGFTVCGLMVAPLLALVMQAFEPGETRFGQMFATVLPSYIANTFWLMLGVSVGSLLLAVPAAWLVARCEFRGRRLFQWALLLPLAMPAYIVAYVYTDLLDYAGPVQRFLRASFGWQSVTDYWFPDIRTLGGATVMLSLVLFPYVYLLGRTAFLEQSLSLQHAAKVMGCSPWQSFWRLSLPMARPALAAGVALVAMETMADLATVNYFAVSTLTTAVYDTWRAYGDLAAAAKISLLMLLGVFTLFALERMARRKQQLFQKQLLLEAPEPYRLKGWREWLALGYCSLLLLLAFVLPFVILGSYALDYWQQSWNSDFWQYSLNSLTVAAISSVLCLLLAILLMFIRRLSPRKWDMLPSRLVSTGYALPGTVLAIAVLIPLTWLDFRIDDLYALFERQGPGLLFTGSIAALVLAFCIRFAAIAIGSIESSYKRLSPSLDMAAISLGKTPGKVLALIHLPLLRSGIFAALLLVFIEAMKELPAALLLSPVGFHNLATQVFQYVSDEQLEQGALAAIVIVLVGLVPLIYLNRSLEQNN
ncbi:ABC transporter permease [Shewanella algae]|uniref:ABC transporter permease n=1 Tax=Shewanella algae TaxID=38313 RepID=UPI001183317F|nr:iron ABC transporter permease [Shewanella algae]TVL14026.1 iron ABC transporter permease [Shewanella algae]